MRALGWIAVPLLLLGAVMLVADIGAAGIWIGVIAVGVAMVAIAIAGGRSPHAPVKP